MKKEKSWEKAAFYGMKLGHNADELLDVLGDYYYSHSSQETRAANVARLILLQALVDIERIMPRAVASWNYVFAEGIEGGLVKYLDERLLKTSKEVKRLHKRRRAR